MEADPMACQRLSGSSIPSSKDGGREDGIVIGRNNNVGAWGRGRGDRWFGPVGCYFET